MAHPLNVISGFLGSGKTTLLNRFLADDSLKNSIVLINEFGEVGLDHLLVDRLDDKTVLLRSGCVCCTVRGDLIESLGSIAEQMENGPFAHVDRVILETTGLVDPAPIAATVGPHSSLAGKFYYDGMLVTVDAMNWQASLFKHREARAQISLADKIYITKLDLCPEEKDVIIAKLEEMNPRAPVFTREDAQNPLELLSAGLKRPSGKISPKFWLAPVEGPKQPMLLTSHSHEHSHVRSFVVVIEEPLRFNQFATWASLFTQMNGERLLRMKALIRAEGESDFYAFDGIRSFVHPPTKVPASTESPQHSTVVFILEAFSEEEEALVRQALKACTVNNETPAQPLG